MTSAAWKTLYSRSVHATRWFNIRQDDVIQPDGHKGTYDHVVLPNSVTVLAIDVAGMVGVTRQWIYTHGGTQWRLPAGGMDAGDATPLAAAHRELAEEVGARADTWHRLGRVHGADSATNHVDHLFLAYDLTMGEATPEACEADLQVHWLRFDTVFNLIVTEKMPHAGSTAAILLAMQRPDVQQLVTSHHRSKEKERDEQGDS